MADGQLKLSRRALLGAVCAAPVLSVVEGPALAAANRTFQAGENAPWRDFSVTFGAPPSSRQGPHRSTTSMGPRRPGSPGGPLGAPSPRDPGLRRDDGAPVPSPAEGRWEKALARYRAAEAALAAAEKGPEEVYNRLGARHHSALARLLTTPAPDVGALALKLDLSLYDRTVEFTADAAAMKALKLDAHRLSHA
jgi:hypothetical protein